MPYIYKFPQVDFGGANLTLFSCWFSCQSHAKYATCLLLSASLVFSKKKLMLYQKKHMIVQRFWD